MSADESTTRPLTAGSLYIMVTRLPRYMQTEYLEASTAIGIQINHDGRYGFDIAGMPASWWLTRPTHPEYVARCAAKYAELYQRWQREQEDS